MVSRGRILARVFTAVLLVLGGSNWASAQQNPQPTINSAVINYNNKTITITGTGFLLHPAISFDGITLSAKTASATQIVAAFPSASPPANFTPGIYFLNVK